MEIVDDGYAQVTIRGADGEATTVTVDVFQTMCELTDLSRGRPPGSPMTAYTDAVGDMMCRLGFPRVSAHAALKFAEAIMDRVGGLKKKEPGSPEPGSPGSTTSTPTS